MIHLLISWLLRPLLQRLAGHAPNPPQHVLVIQMAKIGDLICSTAVFRELKRRYPDAQVHVMANPINAPLLRANPHVDAVIEADARHFGGGIGKALLARRMREGGYDTVICLNAGAAYATAALWAGIPRRLAVLSNYGGTSHRLAARLWTDVEPHRPTRLIQETYRALLARLDVDGSSAKEVHAAPGAAERVDAVLAAATGPLVGIAVSSGNRLKALGVEKIVAVARRLIERCPTATLVLIGGPEDVREAREIVAALPHGRVLDSCGRLGLADLPALLVRMAVFLGVDSGLTYMADALEVPIVSVAGPVDMVETRPVGEHVAILQREDLPCAPCSHTFRAPYTCRMGTRECIVGIDVPRIVAAVMRFLPADSRNGDTPRAS
ncbi:MAG: glycosyltransferase family 9 protein [Rhodocyclaceae bacterium]|jgi:ADP-heptose:LPS heptosyltransferase|nr:glycosyltransferase family 9 protein [Rhodocyclaceae bacterium]